LGLASSDKQKNVHKFVKWQLPMAFKWFGLPLLRRENRCALFIKQNKALKLG
jgi:hypothetical protein